MHVNIYSDFLSSNSVHTETTPYIVIKTMSIKKQKTFQEKMSYFHVVTVLH